MHGGDYLNIGAQVLEELADGLRAHLGPASLDVPGLLQLDMVLPSFLKVDNPALPWHAVNPSRLQTVLNTVCLNKKLNIPLVHGILELGTRDQALDNGFVSGFATAPGAYQTQALLSAPALPTCWTVSSLGLLPSPPLQQYSTPRQTQA
jgi:hypothetical protein